MNTLRHIKFNFNAISGQKGASIKGESGLPGYDGEKGDKGDQG